MPESSTAEFYVTGEIVRSTSGKTVKIYVFEYGKHCFIGQVTCRNLRELLDGSSLKVGLQKYRNVSEATTSDNRK
jgi:hypothetical protein